MRNWYNFVWLCGDGLVEQAVHSIDKIAWAMRDAHPLKAVAVGGRQIPNHEGNIYDHIEVNYEFDNGVRAFMGQRQTTGCHNQNADYIMGTKGTATIGAIRRRDVDIAGAMSWTYEGEKPDMYQVEHNELFASIRAGQPLNDGVRMANSTMLAIMGFVTCYQQIQMLKEMGTEYYPESETYDYQEHPRPKKHLRKGWFRVAARKARQEQKEQAKIDAILAKVHDKGLHSLSWWEKRTLRKATERQRQQDLAEKL